MILAPEWAALFANERALLSSAAPFAVQGRLVRAAGLVLEASGLRLPVGSLCLVSQSDDVGLARASTIFIACSL